MLPLLDTRRVVLSQLHHDPANVRLHDARNLDSIKASLKTFGQVEPLVVQKGTGKVIGGNGRLQAMRELGWTEAMIVEVQLSESQATALAIALNRSAELAAWDQNGLAQLLHSLEIEEWDLDSLGFNDEDLAKMRVGEDAAPLGDEAFGSLPAGEKKPFQQMSFVLHESQVEQVERALKTAVDLGPFASENTNRYGNALARICETFLTQADGFRAGKDPADG